MTTEAWAVKGPDEEVQAQNVYSTEDEAKSVCDAMRAIRRRNYTVVRVRITEVPND